MSFDRKLLAQMLCPYSAHWELINYKSPSRSSISECGKSDRFIIVSVISWQFAGYFISIQRGYSPSVEDSNSVCMLLCFCDIEVRRSRQARCCAYIKHSARDRSPKFQCLTLIQPKENLCQTKPFASLPTISRK